MYIAGPVDECVAKVTGFSWILESITVWISLISVDNICQQRLSARRCTNTKPMFFRSLMITETKCLIILPCKPTGRESSRETRSKVDFSGEDERLDCTLWNSMAEEMLKHARVMEMKGSFVY
ncbi:unnamed protein product [Microthlaspi erraticum]|uniref:Uncharacterized protein n=1 Tax=Microthlaspi erraticum TaxID=1685480 RepID=A0A6D2HP95_9BRAS|nr:unnamed protein product [Microthlaspi erraticum]